MHRTDKTLSAHSLKKLKLWRPGKRRRAQVAARFWFYDVMLASSHRRSMDELLAELPVVHGQWPEQGDQPIVFAVCDPHYFSLHAESLMASLNRYAPDSYLHLHLYDPCEDQFEGLADLCRRYRQVHLTRTWEQTGFEGVNGEKRVIYFQSARFIRLFSILQAARRPVITVDIDSLIRGDVNEVVQAAQGADLGLFLRPELAHSGKNVLASMVYASPSPASLDFFEGVARRIAAHLLAGVQTEMLDQRCLWKLYVQKRRHLKFWRISQRFSDWSLGQDSIIWHGKGPRKESRKYLVFKRQLLQSGGSSLGKGCATIVTCPVTRSFRVGWKPQNEEPRVASTRIRCLNPLRMLQAQGLSVELYKDKRKEDYDMVVFLKAYNENDIRLAESLKAQGKIVIFDLCDNHFLMNERRVARLRRMFQLADHWVTSTPALADVIRMHLTDLDQKPLHIIEDAVETALIKPPFDVMGKSKARWQLVQLARFLKQNERGCTHLVWFGTHQGSHSDSGLAHVQKLKPLLERIAAHYPVTLTVISNSRDSFMRHFAGWQVPLFYMDWNPHSFFTAMKLHHIAVIPIQVNEFTKVKTNNRVAISLYLGLGVVADRIGSYEAFADCIFLDDWENGLLSYITHPELVAEHVAHGRRIITEHYSLPVIAKRWCRLFDLAWKEKNIPEVIVPTSLSASR